jgi:hypothetical protein
VTWTAVLLFLATGAVGVLAERSGVLTKTGLAETGLAGTRLTGAWLTGTRPPKVMLVRERPRVE